MKTEHIKAIMTATARTLRAMECNDIHLQGIKVVGRDFSAADASSVTIEVRGGLQGLLALAFSTRDSARLASIIAQFPVAPENGDDICECMAELANMIAGQIANSFYGLGLRVSITPPRIINGSDLSLEFPQGTNTLLTPVTTSAGRFDLLISLRQETNN